MGPRLTFRVILPTMLSLGCFWNRLRLERYTDGTLGARVGRRVRAHLDGCPACRGEAERLSGIRALVHSALPHPAEPDWAGFWPAVRVRIAEGGSRPIRDPWWLPLWKPVWGHPRLAFGGIMAGALALAFALWPGGERQVPVAWAGPVLVQDVATADPDQSVMVYSSPEHDLTVIWVFSPDTSNDES